jgi:hypothetical protein
MTTTNGGGLREAPNAIGEIANEHIFGFLNYEKFSYELLH